MARRWREIGLAGQASLLAALLMLVGAVAIFVPYLLRARTITAGVPAPPAVSVATDYALAPGHRVCMASVTIEPTSRIAQFAARPAPIPAAGGAQEPVLASEYHRSHGWRPPVELQLSAPGGYHASAVAHGGYGYKPLSVAIVPPSRAVIGNVCFVNRGTVGVGLEGSSEARSVSRSSTMLAGTSVVGDVAIAFREAPPRSLLSSLGTLFGRASGLKGGLIPVWLIWVFAVLVACAVPLCVLMALHWALSEDQA